MVWGSGGTSEKPTRQDVGWGRCRREEDKRREEQKKPESKDNENLPRNDSSQK